MNIRQIQEAREMFGIDEWGAGYFGINDQGHVVCHPTGEELLSIDLPEAIEECKLKGIKPPMILRFPQIIECQLTRMHTAFKDAIAENKYEGNYRAVFPFKVNQRREVIDHIVACGYKRNYGLEVGSKTEFMAALSYRLADDALFICNGFKDREFIEMGFVAATMGKKVLVVVEGPDELQMIIDQAPAFPVCPEIGVRMRLYSKGSGKWIKSSGEMSKFGLTTVELLKSLDMLKTANLQNKLLMLHFHIGSQITDIKRIKNALKEAARVYAKVVKSGYNLKYLNIGGGVGVDYDGSKTNYHSSANYSLQEFANDAVFVISDVCRNEEIPCPDIVTESGRVIVAYHSVLVTNIREVQGKHYAGLENHALNIATNTKSHKGLVELKYILDNINRKNYVEYYHDANEYHDELFTLFNLGYLRLEERAFAEDLFQKICHKALYYSSFSRHQLEEFEDLQDLMVSKYLANLSIFQSIPDAWSIDQLFPVMPLSNHDEKPSDKASIVDITCDSDGCLEKFIDRRDVKKALDLHPPNGKPYYIGFFLVGAYQESLASEHNLFGAINEAEIIMLPDGNWEVAKTTEGDPIDELLMCRNYSIEQMCENYKVQLDKTEQAGTISAEIKASCLEKLQKYMKLSPYLLEK